ncbi:spermidine synthase [Streptomyces sp. NPDC058045]|uniref:spermine/spermidine synthase domain-containing protein n=1 Tax=Streptomyces sp. NPDC058045 TaxID=3346311 RepID=UPI0036E613FD
MIESHTPVPSRPPMSETGPARLPVGPTAGRFLVLTGAFVCAACGLVYELELVALASTLIGDTVTQTSVVLSVMVFAMGVGSLAAKRLRHRAAAGFAALEALLGLVGGCSAMALYAAFAWTGGVWPGGSRWLLAGFSLTIGVLIGAEVPLLMVLIQRVRRQDAGGAVADLFAADYVGALIGGLAFPFALLPLLGQLTGALLTGAVNTLAGGALVLGLFRGDLSRRGRRALLAANLAVLTLLTAAALTVDDFEAAARQAVYGPQVRLAARSADQDIVLTGHGETFSLYVDGRLRRPPRHLARPALDGPHRRVLILGGGDGRTARTVLTIPGVHRVDLLDPDPGLVRLARTDPALTRLNHHALADPRLTSTAGDVLTRLRTHPGPYDVILCDLPAPGTAPTLYAAETYGLLARALSPGGRLAVHTGPARTPALATVTATLRAAGLHPTPYTTAGQGYVLATRTPRPTPVPHPATDLPPRTPSTLLHPRYGS